MRKIFTITLLACLTACGGGGSDIPTVQPTELLVIGNSITRHGPKPEIGWYGDWGMAASSRDNDFAHTVGRGLNLPVTAINAADNERNPAAPLPVLAVKPTTVVVVELGDNGMPAKYAELLASVKGGARLACVSTWWLKPDRDAAIKAACEAAGGTYVYIGDLYPARKDKVGTYADPGVDGHPQDWGMAQIAARILDTLR